MRRKRSFWELTRYRILLLEPDSDEMHSLTKQYKNTGTPEKKKEHLAMQRMYIKNYICLKSVMRPEMPFCYLKLFLCQIHSFITYFNTFSGELSTVFLCTHMYTDSTTTCPNMFFFQPQEKFLVRNVCLCFE